MVSKDKYKQDNENGIIRKFENEVHTVVNT